MAATAVYINITKVTIEGNRGQENVNYSNINATTGQFGLNGGLYDVSLVGSTFGTVTLQVLGPDGTTWLTALNGLTANGTASGYLAPGQYRVALS